MKFPLLEKLATTDVIHIDINATIKEAIALMLNNNHRNIIVTDGHTYRIFMISKVIYIKKKEINQNSPLKELHLPKIVALHKKTNILKCVEYINGHIEYVCTLNSDGTLHGIITLTDIISHIDPDTLIENYTLREYLYLGTSIMQAHPDEIVLELFDKFEHSRFDSVVCTQDQYPIGILTAKDILISLKKNIDLNISAKELMTSPIVTLEADSTVKDALEFIHAKSFKRVVVVDSKGFLVGAITQKELISL
ncbi:MAG: CBS domain-containing protein, partial [Campylobacterota bacterium]|nr:CBS domain-containing protein [Campylobacterota bacterium]